MYRLPIFPKQKKGVYLDHAAATPIEKKVSRMMNQFSSESFANPSSLYSLGVTAKQAVEKSREQIAVFLLTTPDTIVFTSGATESNNWVIFGIGEKKTRLKKHIITTMIEHQSVLEPIRQLEKKGIVVTYLKPDHNGFIDPDQVREALKKETKLISVQYANNEIGTIQPLAEIGRLIMKWRKQNKSSFPLLHSDASQAVNYLSSNVEALHVDFMSFNGSKIYGPKGVGVLYKRRGISLEPLLYGGGQENELRSGTENVLAIVGMGRAVEVIGGQLISWSVEQKKLRDYFWEKIKKNIPDVKLNGPTIESDRRLPNNLNISIKNVLAEALVFYLDSYGIQCSTGSACASNKNEASPVLYAIGLSKKAIESSVRFTLGRSTTKSDIDYVLTYLSNIVKALRSKDKK